MAAAGLLRDRVRVNPELVVAAPAGRTPRRMYALLREMQARDPVDFSRLRVFSVDELCPPAPGDGYFWRQVRREFLAWAAVPDERCHPFRVEAGDENLLQITERKFDARSVHLTLQYNFGQAPRVRQPRADDGQQQPQTGFPQ